MRARIGDYIRFNEVWGDSTSKRITSKVVSIRREIETYETESGDLVCENELSIDDVLLPSEVE